MVRRCITPGDYGVGVAEQVGWGASHEDCARGVSMRVIFVFGGALLWDMKMNAEFAEGSRRARRIG